MRAPSRGVTLSPWVLRLGKAWAGPPSIGLPGPDLMLTPRLRPSLLEAVTVRRSPGWSPCIGGKEGLGPDMLATTTPSESVASRWKVWGSPPSWPGLQDTLEPRPRLQL